MNFLGIDLSTQALKAIVVDRQLREVKSFQVGFDQDLPHYGYETLLIVVSSMPH